MRAIINTFASLLFFALACIYVHAGTPDDKTSLILGVLCMFTSALVFAIESENMPEEWK